MAKMSRHEKAMGRKRLQTARDAIRELEAVEAWYKVVDTRKLTRIGDELAKARTALNTALRLNEEDKPDGQAE